MPDTPDTTDQNPPTPGQQQTPGQLLAGPPQLSNAPINSRPGQPPSLPVQPPVQQQAPPPPSPQQLVAAKHQAVGQAASFLFGQQRDPQTGAPVKQPPGQLFRSLLAGALLGGAMGSEGHAGGGSVGGFLSGFSRGGNAVVQQQYQRQQAAQEQQQRQEQMSLEERKFQEEQMQNKAQLEHWNLENLARGREADYRDRDQLLHENEQDANIQKWAAENGAYLAPSIPNNAVPGNGPELMKQMAQNPARFNPPSGMGRLLVKQYDFDGLDHDSKNGWTEDGKPVDWSKHLKWSVYYVPQNSTDKNQITMSGADWHRLYGVNFPADADPNKMYNVKAIAPLISVATQNRKQEREDNNANFRSKHDALNATVQAARANITHLESEKRQLIGQGFGEDDDEVKEVQQKIDAEQKREQDAISDMHPRIRERVSKQTPAAQPANKAATASFSPKNTSAGQGAPARRVTPPSGKTVVYDPQNTPHFVDSDKLKAFLADPQYRGWHQ